MSTSQHDIKIRTLADTKDLERAAKAVRKDFEGAEAAAGAIGKSKAASAAFKAASPTGASFSGEQLTAYGQTRAMRPGGTGASARDFAQEAQGLGGLVRLYATYAANVFAVGAAFTALSAAQDTANMVKGLNQLGAASGVSLGRLSKDLAFAADGAISLREAMEATVKASSSGMASKDILRMGEVAKKASIALGVNMSDAMSRLSRGITKLEPELLDELGIFTRIDPAVQKYAKSVNKTVGELTQFERQMAFANAVLEEGEQKFGVIEGSANSYTKLLAELKNTATTIGNAINAVLEPLVRLLSNSPTALLLGIGALASMITRQALPALGHFKEALREATNTKALDAYTKAQNNTYAKAVTEVDRYTNAISKLASEQNDILAQAEQNIISKQKRIDKNIVSIMQQAGLEQRGYTPEEMKQLEDATKRRSALKSSYVELYKSAKAYNELEALQQDALREQAVAQEALNKAKKDYGTIRANNFAAEQAASAAVRSEIANQVAQIASTDGVRAAFGNLRQEMSNYWKEGKAQRQFEIETIENGKRVTQQVTLTAQSGNMMAKSFAVAAIGVRGAFGIMGAAAQTFGNVLNTAMGWIGLILGAVAMFSTVFDGAAKQVEKFSESVDRVKDNSENLIGVLERINKVNASEVFSAKTLDAFGTSIKNAGDGLEGLFSNYSKAQEALKANTFSNVLDFFKAYAGMSVDQKAISGLTEQVQSLLKVSGKIPGQSDKIRQALTEAIGPVNFNNAKALSAALEKLFTDDSARERFVNSIQKAGVELSILASKQKEIQAAITASSEAFKEWKNSFADKSPFTKYLGSSLEQFSKLSKEMSGGSIVSSIESIEKLTEAAKTGATVLSVGQVSALSKATDELVVYRAQLNETSKSLNKLQDEFKGLNASDLRGSTGAKTGKARNRGDELKQDIERLTLLKNQLTQSIDSKAPLIGSIIKDGMMKGADISAKVIELSMAKGSTAFAQGVLALLPQTASGFEQEAKLRAAEFGFESELLKIQRDQLIAQKQIELNTRETNAREVLALAKKGEGQGVEAAQTNLDNILKAQESLKGGSKGVRNFAQNLNSSKTSEAASLQKEMFEMARSLGGLDQQLSALGSKAKLEILGGAVKAAKERIATESKGLEVQKQQNNTEQAQLKLKIAKQGYETLSDEETSNTLRNNQELLALEQERLAIVADVAAFEKVMENSAARAQIGKERINETLQQFAVRGAQLREKTEQQSLSSEERLALLTHKRYKLAQEVAQVSTETSRKYLDIEQQSQEYALERADLELSIREIRGDFEFNQEAKAAFEATQQRARYELEAQNKKIAAQRKFEDEALSILDRLNKTGEKNLQDELKAKLLALAKEAEVEIQNIEDITNLRLKAIQEEANARAKAFENKATDSLAEIIAEAFFEGGKSGLEMLKDNLKSVLREAFTDSLKQSLRGSLAGVISAVGGKSGYASTLTGVAGGGGAMGQTSGILGAIQGLFSASGGVIGSQVGAQLSTVGAKLGLDFGGQVGSFLQGMQSSIAKDGITKVAAQSGAELAGSLVSSVLDGMAAYGLQKAISGGYKIGNGKFMDVATTIAGVFLGPLAGVVGGLINRAFGRKLKDSGIEASFGGDQGFTGKNYQFYKGGWFRSDKTTYSDMDSEVSKMFKQQFLGMQRQLMLTAGGLSIANADNLSRVANFKKDIKISTQGKTAEEAQQMIQDEFDKMGDAMAKEFLMTAKTTTEIVKKTVEVTTGWWEDYQTTIQEVDETVTNTTYALREDLPAWMQDIVELSGPTMEALNQIKEYPNQLLEQFGVARDDLVKTFAEGLMTGKTKQAGQLVANNIVKSIEMSMYTNASGQIFDIMNQGLITPILDAALKGKVISEALSQASINATLQRARDVATALASIFKDEKFKELLNQIKEGFGSSLADLGASFTPASFQQLPTTFEDLSNSAEDAADSTDTLTDKLKELQEQLKSSITDLFSDLVSKLKSNASTIKSNIDKVKSFTKSMLDFKNKVLLGENSTMTSAQKYALSKSNYETTLQKALAGDEDSISKLQSVSESFLTASRDFYASGEQYAADFQSVLASTDLAISSAKTLEENLNTQLVEANTWLAKLGSVDDSLKSIEEILEVGLGGVAEKLVNAMDATGVSQASVDNLVALGVGSRKQIELLLQAVDRNGNSLFDKNELEILRNQGATTSSAMGYLRGSEDFGTAWQDGRNTYGDNVGTVAGNSVYYTSTGGIATAAGFANASGRWDKATLQNLLMTEGAALFQSGQSAALLDILTKNGIDSLVTSALTGIDRSTIKDWAASYGFPSFDVGSSYIPYDTMAAVHQGERIFTRAENEEIVAAVKNNSNQDLVQEIRQLNAKIAKLEETMARGSVANVQATDRNTDAIVGIISSTTDKQIHASQIKERAVLK